MSAASRDAYREREKPSRGLDTQSSRVDKMVRRANSRAGRCTTKFEIVNHSGCQYQANKKGPSIPLAPFSLLAKKKEISNCNTQARFLIGERAPKVAIQKSSF